MHGDMQEIYGWLTAVEREMLEVSVYTDPRVWRGQVIYDKEDVLIEVKSTTEFAVWSIIFRPAEYPKDYDVAEWRRKYHDPLAIQAIGVIARGVEKARHPNLARLVAGEKIVGTLLIPSHTRLGEIGALLRQSKFRKGYHDLRDIFLSIRGRNSSDGASSSSSTSSMDRRLQSLYEWANTAPIDEEPLPQYESEDRVPSRTDQEALPRYSTVLPRYSSVFRRTDTSRTM